MNTTPDTELAERWGNHVSEMWFDRSQAPWTDPRGAFDEAEPVHYPSAEEGSTAYYHPEGDVVFIEHDDRVRTCIALRDRPKSEQAYVREQLEVNDR